MSLTTVQLWQAMQESEIATASDCRVWAGEILAAAGNSVLDDPQLMLSQLVKLGHITPFQASALLSDDMQTLVVGRHRLLAKLTSPALQDWFEAIDPTTNASRWLYALSRERLKSTEIDRHPPSLKLAKLHASIQGEGLQSLSPPAFVDDYLLIAATPAVGRPLRDAIKSLPKRMVPTEKAIRIVRGVAKGLSQLHQHGIVHGSIGIDQIWWDGQDEVTLLRDPFFPPVTPLGIPAPAAVGDPNDQDFRIRYAAPEFTAPGQQPTIASDVYALGCLWWELLTGQAPYADVMLDKVPTAAAKFPLPLPQELSLSNDLRRCLAHMLAKNPSTRFSDAGQVLQALDIVAPPIPPPAAAAPSPPPPPVPPRASVPAAPPAPPSPPPREGSRTPAPERVAEPPATYRVSQTPLQETAVPQTPVPASPVQPSPVRPSPIPPSSVPPKGASPSVVPTSSVPQSSAPRKATTEDGAATEHRGKGSPQQAAPTGAPTITADAKQPPAVAPLHGAAPKQAEGAVADIASESAKPVPTTIVGTTIGATSKTTPPPPSIVGKPTARPVSGDANRPAAPPKAGRKKGKGKSKRPVWLLPSMLVGCLGLFGVLVWALSPKSTTQTQTATNPAKPANPVPAAVIPPVAAVKPRQEDPREEQFHIEKQGDDLAWLPPRAAQPYALTMIPPGAQGFLFVRPQPWLESPHGTAIVDALTPSFGAMFEPIIQHAKIAIEDIDELAIALYSGRDDGWPILAYRIGLRQPTKVAALQERWSGSVEQAVGDKGTLRVQGPYAFYVGANGNGPDQEVEFIAMGPLDLMRELAEQAGAAGPLRRQMEQLWQASDSQADFTALISTGFFFAGAREVIPSVAPGVHEWARSMLAEKSQALLVTTSLAPQWYGELRMIGNHPDDASRFLEDFREKMQGVADRVEASLVAQPAEPYWRALASRFPQMLRGLFRYQRFGLENGQAISNFYLPPEAASNVSIASWMMAMTTPSQSPQDAASSTSSQPGPVTGDTLLTFPVSIGFDQEPLDSALNLIKDGVNTSLPAGSPPIEIAIDGKAFELASVTRNQQIRDFRYQNKPLRLLLTDLAARLNPDRTVKALTEAKQAVIWVFTTLDGKPTILFTTRQGVEGTDRKIPTEFAGS